MDRHALLAVVEDLSWPAVDLGSLEISGEAAWRSALIGYPPAPPGERGLLLGELGPYLLEATEGGGARLAAWRTSGRKVQESPEEVRERIRERVAFYGDLPMLWAVVEAFAATPPPVRDTLLAEVAIVGVGWSSGGWCASALGVGPDGEPRPRLIVLSGAHRDAAWLAHIARHELGHAWLQALPGPYAQAVTARGEAEGFALARAEGWACLPSAEAAHAREERLAEAMAEAWAMESPR